MTQKINLKHFSPLNFISCLQVYDRSADDSKECVASFWIILMRRRRRRRRRSSPSLSNHLCGNSAIIFYSYRHWCEHKTSNLHSVATYIQNNVLEETSLTHFVPYDSASWDASKPPSLTRLLCRFTKHVKGQILHDVSIRLCWPIASSQSCFFPWLLSPPSLVKPS